MKTIEEMIVTGRNLALYPECEQADQKTNDAILDALWQSIYDVCRLIMLGVIEDDEEDEELQEAITWLKETQGHTQQYQELPLDF